MKVLIVDDHDQNLYLLRVLLEGYGCAVDDARHGAEALVKARQSPPQLVISDLLMPVMDGYTLLRHWKADERLKAIPFVVYTATYTEPKDERLALDLGADAFIVKPAETEVFMARIQAVLARQQGDGRSPVRVPQGEETVLLREYGEVVVRKLEAKAALLEQANRALQVDIARRQQAEAQANRLLEEAERARSALLAALEEQRKAEVALRENEKQRWALEAQLRQQQKLESIGTLAGGVAHEINNPINGIMNYAQLIQDRLGPGSPLAEYTGEIIRETQRIAAIVHNLLTFARNEKQSHSPARVADIVERTLSLIRAIIRHDQITLTVNLPAGLPELRCRSQQIQQVLMNLMTNARDALNSRYPGYDPDKVLEVSARLFQKEGRRCIRVTVEDHGTGIEPEVRERMFDPFFTTKPRDQGTGLGLSISHGIVKDHHGELSVETELGRFTRMHLDLPVDNDWNL